ncbi:MAG TPA: PVC-type heme-binding CxxCH protein, partial [Pirellulales bacterium]
AAPAAVPSGYSIAVAASQPLVKRPLFAALDDAGALYVLESGGANGNDRREKPSDLIRRLTDENGDGVYDRAEVFAEGIVFGAGLAWHDGALFVTSPPSLWKFEDRDRDGTAERRTELVTAFAFNQSCTDDAHGAVLGPDGRIYFLPGRFPHRIQAPNGSVVREGYGPWLMRCRPDGSEIEVVGGAVGNPVEVAFSAAGDAFVQGTFWAKPSVGDGLRDAVIHAIPGGEYSVRDRDYTDRIRTGDFLPALVPLTATAPSGLAVVRGAELGDESQGALFTSHFNTGKILRHRLRDNGATFSTQAEDFVVANNRDVHFTDVLEDADGSLLVVDTGGWYLACCPASGSARPNILGGIYRVSRDGAKRPADPSGRELAWDDASIDSLIERLDDDRWRVRDRAIAALAKRGGAAIEALQKTLKDDASSTRAKLAATWTLCRIDAPAAREIARIALDDSSAEVRQAAASSAALHRDAGALEKLVERLADPAPRVRREAAHALGRIGDSNAVAPLLQAVSDAANALPTKGDDGAAGRRFAEHALIFSLIEIDAPEVTRAGL